MTLRSLQLLILIQPSSFLFENGHGFRWRSHSLHCYWPPFREIKRVNEMLRGIWKQLFSDHTHLGCVCWFIRWEAHVNKAVETAENMSSSSVIPVVLWGNRPPSHCISCIITTYDQKTIVTGSTDGQLGIWDVRFADNGEIKVRPW